MLRSWTRSGGTGPVPTTSKTGAATSSCRKQLVTPYRILYIYSELYSNTVISMNNFYFFFRLLFGGTLPHYFYELVERIFSEDVVAFPLAKKLLFERLIYAPMIQAFSLYTLARFEGKNHKAALKQLFALYWPILEANWKWLTLFQVINLAFVPPMVRIIIIVIN